MEQLVADPALRGSLASVTEHLAGASQRLRALIGRVREDPVFVDRCPPASLDELISDIEPASEGVPFMIDALMSRHVRVQKAKKKGVWIDVSDTCTLLPQFGLAEAEPRRHEGIFLHPFRIPNAYSFLGELGQVRMEVPDGEA